MEKNPKISLVERREAERSLKEFYAQGKRVVDAESGLTLVKLFAGDCYVTSSPKEVLATVLGSCVAVCIRDPIARVGGMNHFLLPGEDSAISPSNEGARYGVFAMEQLINGLLKAGAKRENFEIKLFGGGNVIKSSSAIGSKNAAFIREFLAREGYRIAACDLEGALPRRIHYYPITGKVMLLRLRRRDDALVAEYEKRTQMRITQTTENNIDLF